MDASVIAAVIAALAALGVATIQALAYRKEKLNGDRQEDAFEFQIECGNLIIAIGALSFITSLAVTGQHTNGNVEEAQTRYKEALTSYEAMKEKLARKWIAQ